MRNQAAETTTLDPQQGSSSCAWTFISANRKDGSKAWTILDREDYEWAKDCRWYVNAKGYFIRNFETGGTFAMAREILGLERGDPREADHINRNRADNRRCNLRIVTRAQQLQNVASRGGASQYRNVSYQPHKYPNKPWVVQPQVAGKKHWLGSFATEDEAAEVARAFRANNMTHATD